MPDLLISTNNVIEVEGVTNADTGAPITSATVLMYLYNNADDTQITGETWPVTLAHDASGTYNYNLSYLLGLAPCMQCRAEFSVDDGPGFHKEWEALYDAVYGTLTANIFFDNTDHVVTVDGLEDALNPGTYINAADVEITLTDLSDTKINGEVWPLTLTYVAASNGKYKALLRDTLDVAEGDVVKVLITADNGAGYHREWRSILTVETGT